MLLKVDFSLATFRWLFQPLYQAVLTSAMSVGDTELLVKGRFLSFLLPDPNITFLIDLEENIIKGHCICVVNANTAILEQLEGTEEFKKQCLQYLEQHTEATSFTIFLPESDYLSFKTTFEFEVPKVALTRVIKRD